MAASAAPTSTSRREDDVERHVKSAARLLRRGCAAHVIAAVARRVAEVPLLPFRRLRRGARLVWAREPEHAKKCGWAAGNGRRRTIDWARLATRLLGVREELRGAAAATAHLGALQTGAPQRTSRQGAVLYGGSSWRPYATAAPAYATATSPYATAAPP